MRTRKLGKSGLEVPEIGLGTWGLSGESYGPVSQVDAKRTVERALDEGVLFVETAGCYGPDGRVERMLGEVIRARGRGAMFVCTRIGVDRNAGHGPPRKRFDKEGLEMLADDSLRRLGVDYIDALILHNPLTETIEKGDAIDTLRGLRMRGKAKLVGVSVSTVEAGRRALAADIDLIELPYSLLFTQLMHRLVSDIARSKVGVIVRSPLAYGVLAGTWAANRSFGEFDHRTERWSPSELARRVRQREAMRYLVHDDIHTLVEASLRYVLANRLVSVVVPGARTPDHAAENAHAADVLPYLPEADLSSLGEKLREQGIETGVSAP